MTSQNNAQSITEATYTYIYTIHPLIEFVLKCTKVRI